MSLSKQLPLHVLVEVDRVVTRPPEGQQRLEPLQPVVVEVLEHWCVPLLKQLPLHVAGGVVVLRAVTVPPGGQQMFDPEQVAELVEEEHWCVLLLKQLPVQAAGVVLVGVHTPNALQEYPDVVQGDPDVQQLMNGMPQVGVGVVLVG